MTMPGNAWEHEQPQPHADAGTLRRLRRNVTGAGLQHLPGDGGSAIAISVPCELAGHLVSVRLYPEQRGGRRRPRTSSPSHARGTGPGSHRHYDWQHYLPLIERKPGALRNGAPFADLPEPLLRLSRALLRREGGDRVMAKVLSAVPVFGLDAVLVAVELVLESGRPSAEHVLNVLAAPAARGHRDRKPSSRDQF